MGTREAGLLKQRHGRGVAEGSERQLQRANAASAASAICASRIVSPE